MRNGTDRTLSVDRVSGEALTKNQRLAIERKARIAGGISRAQAFTLLAHIDQLHDLLNIILSEGPEWGDEQWGVASDAAVPLLDGWPVRTGRKYRQIPGGDERG